eukprot:jgi/Bigna1/77630/fgenesh1_pg.49_\
MSAKVGVLEIKLDLLLLLLLLPLWMLLFVTALRSSGCVVVASTPSQGHSSDNNAKLIRMCRFVLVWLEGSKKACSDGPVPLPSIYRGHNILVAQCKILLSRRAISYEFSTASWKISRRRLKMGKTQCKRGSAPRTSANFPSRQPRISLRQAFSGCRNIKKGSRSSCSPADKLLHNPPPLCPQAAPPATTRYYSSQSPTHRGLRSPATTSREKLTAKQEKMGEEGGEKKIQDRAPYAITWWHVAAFSVVQLTSNLIYRFAYPYAPFIAPALGLNLNEYAVFLLAMDLASIGCGFIILAFRSISKYSIAGVHMLQTVTTLLVPILVPVFAELGISLFGLVALRLLTGVGFFLLGSMQRAIIGHYVEAGHKARFLAVYEMCWNFSSIMLGMFGQLIGQYGALTAFFGLGLLSLLSLFIAFPFYPEDMNVRQQEKQQHHVDSKSETGNIPLLASSKHPDSQYGSVNKIEGGSETEDGHKLGDGASCWGSLSGVWDLMQKNAAIVFASRVLVTYYLFNFALTGATSAFNTNFGVW